MPAVFRSGPYRFFFYAGDGDEPPHIHVDWEGNSAKFWLEPVRLFRSGGFGRAEVRRIHKIVSDHNDFLLGAWHEYFGR
jgi:hypothetical protein